MPRQPPPADAQAGIRLFDYLRQLDPALPIMPVIVADEIARQIDALPDAHGASAPASAYGVVVPPFPECFIEAEVLLPDWGRAQRGVLLRDLTKAWRAGQINPAIQRAAPAGTRWLFSATGYLRGAATHGILYGYDGAMLFHLDADGRLLDTMERVQVLRTRADPLPPTVLPGDGLPNHAPYLLKAISAMHERCAADKVAPPRQQRRAAARQGVQELHEYYVLRVKPTHAPTDMTAVGQPSKAAGQRREHMVRGHFRYYSEARPLFGHTTGMIWIPAHERGDSDIGRIQKDYSVGE